MLHTDIKIASLLFFHLSIVACVVFTRRLTERLSSVELCRVFSYIDRFGQTHTLFKRTQSGQLAQGRHSREETFATSGCSLQDIHTAQKRTVPLIAKDIFQEIRDHLPAAHFRAQMVSFWTMSSLREWRRSLKMSFCFRSRASGNASRRRSWFRERMVASDCGRDRERGAD